MRNKKYFLPLMIFIVFSLTFVSWAYSDGLFKLSITTGSHLPGGKAADITPITGQAYTILNGGAQKIAGIPLYKIQLGNIRYSELARFYVSIENMVDDNGTPVLSKENWWVVVSAYYETPIGATPDLVLDDGTKLTKFTSKNAVLYLNQMKASGIIMPQALIPDDGDSTTSQQIIYLVATYINPGGHSPSGQQNQLNNLQFHCMVRM